MISITLGTTEILFAYSHHYNILCNLLLLRTSIFALLYCTFICFLSSTVKKFKKSYTERCSDFCYYVLYISFVIISFVDVAFSIRHYRGLTIGFILELLLVCAIPSMTLRCNFSNQIKIFDLKFFLYSYSINNHCTHVNSSI